jgi:hypothetical protein
MNQFSLIIGILVASFGVTSPASSEDSILAQAEEIFRVDPQLEPAPKEAAPASASGSETLPAEYLENVMVVKTDRGAGTGFLCTHKDRLFVATNQHVIDGAKSLEIEGPTGEKFKPVTFVAARNVDIVLIGVAPGADLRRPLVFAENVEEVVTKGDAVLVPGNSKGDGVITVTPGKVIGLGPSKVEVDCPVYPGNSGGPIFHVKTREVIGLLTEARLVSIDGAVDAASFKDGKSQIKSEVRIFGHRFDTAEKWYALNFNDFRRNSAMIQKVRSELDAVEAFFYPVENLNWKSFRELHAAVNTASQVIATEKLSEADRTRAWSSLTGTLSSLSTRGVRELEVKRPALTYTQVRELELLSQRSEYLRQLSTILARDLQTTTSLVNRGEK